MDYVEWGLGAVIAGLVGLWAYAERQDRKQASRAKRAAFQKEREREENLNRVMNAALVTRPSIVQVDATTPKPVAIIETLKETEMATSTSTAIKTTTNMLCTEAQAASLRAARAYKQGTRAHKNAQIPVMKSIKRDNGLPSSARLKIWVMNPANELYRVLRSRSTGMPLVGPTRLLTPGEAGYKAPATKAVAAPATKAVAKKAPAKKVAATKAPVGVVAKFVKSRPVAASKASPVKTDTHQILMRVSIKGKKVQLGYASSPEAAAKLIAAARKAAA